MNRFQSPTQDKFQPKSVHVWISVQATNVPDHLLQKKMIINLKKINKKTFIDCLSTRGISRGRCRGGEVLWYDFPAVLPGASTRLMRQRRAGGQHFATLNYWDANSDLTAARQLHGSRRPATAEGRTKGRASHQPCYLLLKMGELRNTSVPSMLSLFSGLNRKKELKKLSFE